jgi:membrane protein YqaA with SNARE-associated domain
MLRFVTWLQEVVLPVLGPPGIFLAAFLDSSFLSLPEINDLLVIASAAADARSSWIAVSMATLGSVAGCTALWWAGRKGGEAFLVRRFGAERTERARELFHRYGPLALAVPAIMPPPMPFKIFVLAAGVFGFPWWRFAVTLFLARGARYTAWALVGAAYGDEATIMLRAFDAWAAARQPYLIALLAVLLLATLAVYLLRRRPRPLPEVSGPESIC